MNNTLVRIYQEDMLPSSGLLHLRIGKNCNQEKNESNINFFQSALDCEFFKERETQKWWLVFFKNSPEQQIFCAEFMELPLLDNIQENQWRETYAQKIRNRQNRKEITRLAFVNAESNQVTDMEISYASLGIRLSRAIKSDDYQHKSSHSEHVDGKGLSFITCLEGQQYQFEYRILLMALAYAYLNVMESLSNKLAYASQIANKNNDIKQLTSLYKRATEFNARFFFLLPVKHKNTSLVETWSNIKASLNIVQINSELIQKIDDIHYILDWQKTQKEQLDRDKKQEQDNQFNRKIAIIGTVIAFFGVLEFLLGLYEFLSS
ncbi:Uncharacterised protein [Phocoenobacter uteri]|uniref:Uncharacterized protein n=1 Tax=Phocoenobacter uteri TaxID=146806 RepID=A0A379C9Q2_9PAST|nr:hypothetical protein [Phocoenobacter uteri]MDG6882742.1 hypothetical protein [Phocoenobacter uteri]SUB58909.1 Uncharacterised protein [Phocoenobacter uteri]